MRLVAPESKATYLPDCETAEKVLEASDCAPLLDRLIRVVFGTANAGAAMLATAIVRIENRQSARVRGVRIRVAPLLDDDRLCCAECGADPCGCP